MARTCFKKLRNGANLNFQTVIYVTVMLMAFLSNFFYSLKTNKFRLNLFGHGEGGSQMVSE